jgi:uncharacterized protein (TIGR02246 family)
MLRRLLVSMLAVSLVSACAPKEEPDASTPAAAPDTAALRAEIAPLGDAYRAAVLAGDAAALNALYTDNAVVELTGIPTLVGRGAIMTADSTNFAMGKPTEWNSTVRSTVALGNGNVAQTGSWSDAMPAAGGKTARRDGRWIAGIMKGDDGKWRINYLMGMTDSTVTK